MSHRSSSSGLGWKTTRGRFSKTAMLNPVAGFLSATHPVALQQAMSSYFANIDPASFSS